MSNISRFFKQNKPIKANAFFAATKSLCDEDGKPLEWEIKPLSTRASDEIQESSMAEVPIKGKPGMYRQKIRTTEYIAKLIVASVKSPDLLNAELQDSYGVSKPEDLLREMVDDPAEYNAFATFIQEYQGLLGSLQEEIDEAKN